MTVIELISDLELSLELKPYYFIVFNLFSYFEKFSGETIKSYDISGLMIVDAYNSSISHDLKLMEAVTNQKIDLSKNLINQKLRKNTFPIEYTQFKPHLCGNITTQYLKNNTREKFAQTMVQKQIIDIYSEYVTYTGRNNQTYTRLFKPKAKDIYFNDSTLVYIQKWKIEFNIHDKSYSIEFICDSTRKLIFYSPLLCQKTKKKQPNFLCVECGKLIHRGSFLRRKEGYKCRVCKKTLCSDCINKKNYLIFARKYCQDHFLSTKGEQV